MQIRQKYRAYHTTEAIIGGVTPSLANPETLLLGRLDEHGRLRYTVAAQMRERRRTLALTD
ncbi:MULTISPECIES: hypothetical protein [unclassified Micromonospora]|uniref:hypothetical protein n=1 Tax=unclassified Micromonospora TaxID=2617518 RepID=UPI0033B46E74